MLTILTIALDGMPWLACHYAAFERLEVPWRWIIVEGVADAVACTSWCAKLPGRLSTDGTTEYVRHLCAQDSRITHISQPLWPGKVAMCNAALDLIREPCVLMQIDADELWKTEQLAKIEYLLALKWRSFSHAFFFCNYYVGPDRAIRFQKDGYGNHTAYEWKRAWNFVPGMQFKSHEPPVLDGETMGVDHEFTDTLIGRFRHMAYATRKQMQFRENYYAGHSNPNAHLWRDCVYGWDRLQRAELPAKLKDFFPWVDEQATVIHV